VVRRIRDVEGVAEAYEVMGPYDIIAVIEVEELGQVTQILSHGIRQIPGVATTLTCVTMP
jgi:DNA-binding Lrp family transcriptional regulator